MSGTISDNIDKQSGVISEPAGGVDVESSDPTAEEGLVWFNSTSGVLKVYRTAWATVNSLNTGRYAMAGAGTESSGLSFGGFTGSETAETEEWDGTNWSTSGVGDLSAANRDNAGLGVQTAAVSFGGYNGSSRLNTSEEYNGSSWSSGGALSESVNGTAGAGTLTAGMRCGGET